jgi:hypothetical protein
MKLKVLIASLFVAGFASSFALAGGTRAAADTTTGTTDVTTGATTKTPPPPKCKKVELKGSDAAGTVTFTVSKASKKAKDFAGKPVTLTIPAGSKVNATACLDAAGALTLRGLVVSAKKAAKATEKKASKS